MKHHAHLTLALLVVAFGCNRRENPLSRQRPPHPPTGSGSMDEGPSSEVATVERVYQVTDNGFSCISYQITWHGQQAIVQDPLHATNHAVGDKIGVLVMRHDLGSRSEPNGPKLLNFQILPFVPGSHP